MVESILVSHHLSDSFIKVLQRAVQTIGNGKLLEMQPEALNGIEKGTVLGQPDDQQTLFEQAQRRPHRFAVVVGGIVHHQDQMLTGIVLQQMLDKGDEGVAVFALGGGVSDPRAAPVVGPKDMQELWCTGCRNEFALAAFHPAAAQWRMQAHGCFVHKEEFGLGNRIKRDVFFNHSMTCSAVSWAGRSCRWLRSCLGSFQR